MIFARAFTAALLTTCTLATGVASGQNYPDRPVTMIERSRPAVSPTRRHALLQEPMQRALGQPIVIENIGGAGGMIAAARAARAKPDGYTILLHQDALAAGMTLYPDRTFDAEKDFVTIGLVNTTINTLAGNPDRTAQQFRRTLALDETVRPDHQRRASRCRLVWSFG